MKIIIGLGNYGQKYAKTRHNAGWFVLDFINKKYGNGGFKPDKKLKSETAWAQINNEKVLLVKPQTFMNLSGEAVVAVLGFYKVKPSGMVVIHDDLDLNFGVIRTKKDGGHGGHNGIRDISLKLGIKAYTRIKIGIKSEMKDVMGASNFVLGRFSKDEQAELPKVIAQAESKTKEVLKQKESERASQSE